MTQGRLSIEQVRVRDLPDLARIVLADPHRFAVAPITPLRAESHARNPAADPGDVGLLVAYLEGRCVGYLGVLPIVLLDRGRRSKVNCLSALYVAPEHRQTGAGSLLVLQALSLGRDVVVVGPSDDAARLFRAMRFTEKGPMPFVRVRIEALLGVSYVLGALARRLEGGPWRAALPFVHTARRLARGTVDAALRPLLVRLPRRSLRAGGDAVVVRAATSVLSPAEPRDEGQAGAGPRFERSDATVNWMIAHPWITEQEEPRVNYAFSQRRDRFRFLPLELTGAGDGRRLGYAVLSISSDRGRTVLKILDHALLDGRHRACVFARALREAKRASADVIECGIEWWPVVASSRPLRSVSERPGRTAYVMACDPGGPLGARLPELALGYCDGESPFV